MRPGSASDQSTKHEIVNTTEHVFTLKVEKLKATHHFAWSYEMEVLLRGKGIWPYVDRSGSAVTEKDDETATQKADLALFYILMYDDRSQRAPVLSLCSPCDVRKKLKDTCHSVATAVMDVTLTSLHNIQMSNEETDVEYVNGLKSLVIKLSDAGHTISDLEKGHIVLRCIHKDFVVTKVVRMSHKSLPDAVSQLIAEKSSRNDGVSNEIAMPTGHCEYGRKRHGIRECYKYGEKGHTSRNCGSGKTCNYCKMKGHVVSKCWTNPETTKFRKSCKGGKHGKHKTEASVDNNKKDHKKDFAIVTTTNAVITV